jgi:hypothetical protein
MNESVNPSGEGSEGEQPQDAGLTVDEKFARLAAQIDGTRVEGPGAKEESGRTRELRAKWAENPPEPQPWRSDGPKMAPYPAPEYDAWAKPKKTARDRARGSAKVLVGLLLVGIIAYGFWPRHHSAAQLNATPAGTAEPWTTTPTTASVGAAASATSASPTFTNPDDRYFVGSPALSWADNEAGFIIPKISSLNGVSRGEITDGYQELEKLMEAGNLDATVLNGGSVGDFTSLTDPGSEAKSDLESYIAHPSYAHDPLMLVTRFNPATTRLLGHTVKVDGSMSATAGPHNHTVILTADYVFAYAVGPASGATDEDTRSTVHRTLKIEVVDPAYYNAVSGKAWVYEYAVSEGNDECYTYNGYINPVFDGGGSTPNSTATMNPYATGDLITASAAPSSTSTQEECLSGNT